MLIIQKESIPIAMRKLTMFDKILTQGGN